MRKALSILFLLLVLFTACKSSNKTTQVVKPVYHRTGPKHTHLIDFRIWGNHFQLFKRKRTQKVLMH